MAEELPLDVPFSTAAEWLTKRRVVPATYLKSVRAVQAKGATALEAERPEVAGLAAILPATQTQEGLTYFDCKDVLELLVGAGRGEKHFLGSYSDPYTALWADVCRRYEKNNLHLADAAAFLSQSCNYELPALKGELVRAERDLNALKRRQNDYTRLAEASQQRFVDECSKRKLGTFEGGSLLHVSRADIGEKLRASMEQLRPIFVSFAQLSQQTALRDAAKLYRGFVALGTQELCTEEQIVIDEGKAKAEAMGAACIPVLGRVQELSVEDLQKEAAGAAGAAGAASAAATPAVGGVDWGDDDDAPAAAAAGGGVDWGDDSAGDAPAWDGLIEIESGGESTSPFDLFEDSEQRDALLDDLYELRGFLQQRLAEAKSISGAQEGLPAEFQPDREELESQLTLVHQMCDQLDDAHARHLLLLRSSPRYFERMETSLLQLLGRATKMSGLADDMRARQAELALTMKDVYPKHAAAVEKAKKVKGQFEAALSAHFQGRRVNLMGMNVS